MLTEPWLAPPPAGPPTDFAEIAARIRPVLPTLTDSAFDATGALLTAQLANLLTGAADEQHGHRSDGLCRAAGGRPDRLR
ncbi:MAG: hypothetical protein ACRDSZ_03730 [Pseudonocardiaceae bacterium]